MRISALQSDLICQQVHRHLGDDATIWLFGSRADDQQKGGDVDLYVETTPHPLLSEIKCKVSLQDSLQIAVDLVVRPPLDNSTIAQIAKSQGIRL
ncbi:MAG: nucleotidyltransferase domain-containing protein [Betaproteobacteria bacterium]